MQTNHFPVTGLAEWRRPSGMGRRKIKPESQILVDGTGTFGLMFKQIHIAPHEAF